MRIDLFNVLIADRDRITFAPANAGAGSLTVNAG